MSVNTLVNQQQAATNPPALDDILRVYIIDRLQIIQEAGVQCFSEHSVVTDILHSGISLSFDDQIICKQGLNALRKAISSPCPSDLLLLSFILESQFCDGQVHWAKIFNMLDSVVYMITSNAQNVFLVDQLCHYCESIHVSSDGQTLSEWIFAVGQKVEMIQNQSYNSSISGSYYSAKVEETSVFWAAKCPCGAKPDWSTSDCRKCNKCQKYPCPISGCRSRITKFSHLGHHVKKLHTPEENSLYKKILLRFKLKFCRCGAKSFREKGFNYVECPQCGAFKCLRGECTTVRSKLPSMFDHFAKDCKFPPNKRQNVCGSCGEAKASHRSSVQHCPAASCQVCWCPFCDFEAKTEHSIANHIVKLHRD